MTLAEVCLIMRGPPSERDEHKTKTTTAIYELSDNGSKNSTMILRIASGSNNQIYEDDQRIKRQLQ